MHNFCALCCETYLMFLHVRGTVEELIWLSLCVVRSIRCRCVWNRVVQDLRPCCDVLCFSKHVVGLTLPSLMYVASLVMQFNELFLLMFYSFWYSFDAHDVRLWYVNALTVNVMIDIVKWQVIVVVELTWALSSCACNSRLGYFCACMCSFTLHHFPVAQSLFLHGVMCTHICLPVVCVHSC